MSERQEFETFLFGSYSTKKGPNHKKGTAVLTLRDINLGRVKNGSGLAETRDVTFLFNAKCHTSTRDYINEIQKILICIGTFSFNSLNEKRMRMMFDLDEEDVRLGSVTENAILIKK